MNGEPQHTDAAPGPVLVTPQAAVPYRWYHKAAALIFIIFCFEIGVFLLVFPWLDFWDQNYLATAAPMLRRLWANPYFRGAVSGVGFINLYISFSEVFRLRRFSVPE